jgi:hypothetical protein
MGVDNGPVLRFRRYWWAALDHEFTPHGFCDDETYDRLPRLPEHLFTGDFGWLTVRAAGTAASYMEPNPVPAATMRFFNRRLSRSGVPLPASFVTFMSSAELQRRVPSSTGDDWELSNPAPSPVEQYGSLLQFMHNLDCWYFYLYLAEDGSCPVLGSAELFTPETDDDEDRYFTPAEFMETAFWLAPDFEQFVYPLLGRERHLAPHHLPTAPDRRPAPARAGLPHTASKSRPSRPRHPARPVVLAARPSRPTRTVVIHDGLARTRAGHHGAWPCHAPCGPRRFGARASQPMRACRPMRHHAFMDRWDAEWV